MKMFRYYFGVYETDQGKHNLINPDRLQERDIFYKISM